MSILTDLTPAALTRAIEENLFALFRAIAALPGSELVETEELLLHRTGLSSPMFNGVSRTRGVLLEKVTEHFSQPFFWWTGPQSSPGDLDERLEAAGLLDAGRDSPGMATALADIDEERARPPGVAVDPVQAEAGLQLWGRMFCEAHGAPPAAARAWIDAPGDSGFVICPGTTGWRGSTVTRSDLGSRSSEAVSWASTGSARFLRLVVAESARP